MISNGYLDANIQKAFLLTVPGVTEHQCKPATIIQTARRSKRSLAIAWLDIANAYGSVHHSLIQFALSHYHAPPEFCHLIQSWYSGLSASISIKNSLSSTVPLQIGLYQGDPLSVVIFLSVMATLSDTLQTRQDLGFPMSNMYTVVNHLLYADDTCVIGRSPADCQHLVDMVQKWLQWAYLKVKALKSRSLSV